MEEENPEFWRSRAQRTLQSALDRKLNTNVAKNILFFLGDGKWRNVLTPEYLFIRNLWDQRAFCVCASGMGITTITAARILKGQLENKTGEETVMTMDTFPNVGLAKVHTHTHTPAGTCTRVIQQSCAECVHVRAVRSYVACF